MLSICSLIREVKQSPLLRINCFGGERGGWGAAHSWGADCLAKHWQQRRRRRRRGKRRRRRKETNNYRESHCNCKQRAEILLEENVLSRGNNEEINPIQSASRRDSMRVEVHRAAPSCYKEST